MKKIVITEWKRLVPLKKCVLLMLELAFLVFFIRMIQVWERIQTPSDYMMVFGMLGVAILLIKPIWGYILEPYHCVPKLSKGIGKQKLEEMIENAQFSYVKELENSYYLHKKIKVSDQWIQICNYYFPTNGILMMWIERQGPGGVAATVDYYLWIVLNTGEHLHFKFLVGTLYWTDETPLIDTPCGIVTVLQQVLLKYTNGIGLEPDYSFSDEFKKYAKIMKKYIKANATEYTVEELVLENGAIQKHLKEKVLEERDKVQPKYKRVVLWEEMWETRKIYKQYLNLWEKKL